jgi:hypothetical protein
MEYESVTQNVLLFIKPILQNAKQLQHARLSWHTRCPSGIQSLPGLDQQLPAKSSVFPLLFGSEHYKSLEIALL